MGQKKKRVGRKQNGQQNGQQRQVDSGVGSKARLVCRGDGAVKNSGCCWSGWSALGTNQALLLLVQRLLSLVGAAQACGHRLRGVRCDGAVSGTA